MPYADPARQRAYYRTPEYRLRRAARKYGIDPAELAALAECQGHRCAACGEPEATRSAGGGVRRIAVDHDHATGRVRGLLCGPCNVALGMVGDDPARLRALADYLDTR